MLKVLSLKDCSHKDYEYGYIIYDDEIVTIDELQKTIYFIKADIEREEDEEWTVVELIDILREYYPSIHYDENIYKNNLYI